MPTRPVHFAYVESAVSTFHVALSHVIVAEHTPTNAAQWEKPTIDDDTTSYLDKIRGPLFTLAW